jgi:hypothetical protein
MADHIVGATLFLASNHGQRFCCYCCSSCFLVAVHRDYRHGPHLRSLPLPYPTYLRRRSDSNDLSFGSWCGIDLLHRHHVLLIGDGF